jgi:hypothetical protein
MNMNKIQNKVTCGGIEPYFYKKFCPILTQVPCPNYIIHTNPPQPHKFNHCQLAFFQESYVLQSSYNFTL